MAINNSGLELEILNKANDGRYLIRYRGKQGTISFDKLVSLITNTPSKLRNCKIVNDRIYMKPGYKLVIVNVEPYIDYVICDDKVKVINKDTFEIRTPHGITSIDNSSTGCKTTTYIK